MNYRKLQYGAKLKDWYICKKLNIKLNEWKDVKTGKRALASEKLDLFKKLTLKGRNEWLNQESEEDKIFIWYDSMSIDDLKEQLKIFKINQRIMAEDIGIDVSAINRALNKVVSAETKKKMNAIALMYYYLHDENNKRTVYIPKSKKRKKRKNNSEQKQEELLFNEDDVIEDEPIIIDEIKKDESREKVESEEIIQPNIEELFSDDSKTDWFNEYKKTFEKLIKVQEELDRYRYLIDMARKK